MIGRELVLSKWEDIELLGLDKRARMYRGQRDASWPLRSSIERCCDQHSIAPAERKSFEQRVFREFRRGYHQYTAQLPSHDWSLEWFSLMQHHGAPTRLLDFTYSIFVAMYFGLYESSKTDACIWSVDAVWAYQASVGLLCNGGKPDAAALPQLWTESDEVVAGAIVFNDPQVRMVWPVNPFRLNERLRIQKGLFLAPGDISLTLMENMAALPDHNVDDHVVRIVVPRALRESALHRLFHMNISHTSLFPGLDGYAQSLGVYHPTINKPINWLDGATLRAKA